MARPSNMVNSTSTTTTSGGTATTEGQVVTTSPSKTTTTTSSDPYKTEFVKVYQDAGAIGVAMLTLLVIAALLAILTFRLVKMYSNLVNARDSLDAARVTVIEKLTENIVGIRGEVGANKQAVEAVRDEIMFNRRESSGHREAIVAEVRYLCDRVDRAVGATPRTSRRTKKTDRS